MAFRKKHAILFLLSLYVSITSTIIGATHTSKPVIVEPKTQYIIGQLVVINGWADYNAQPTADISLNFQVTTEKGIVVAEKTYPSDKQGQFQFEFDTRNQLPGIYSITITSQCSEIHRKICSYKSETLNFDLNNP